MSEPPAPILELSTLPQRHPIGDVLFNRYAASVVLRLGVDPTRQPAGTLKRDITVERNTPSTGSQNSEQVCCIGWSELPLLTEAYCVQLSIGANQNDLTEEAAIGVMALLIHELEGVIIERVSQIGSGCDYYLRAAPTAPQIPLEVSGLFEGQAGQARALFQKKCVQLRTRNNAGYVSVTTFRHSTDMIVHSRLHYVQTKPRRLKGHTHGNAKRRKRK